MAPHWIFYKFKNYGVWWWYIWSWWDYNPCISRGAPPCTYLLIGLHMIILYPSFFLHHPTIHYWKRCVYIYIYIHIHIYIYVYIYTYIWVDHNISLCDLNQGQKKRDTSPYIHHHLWWGRWLRSSWNLPIYHSYIIIVYLLLFLYHPTIHNISC